MKKGKSKIILSIMFYLVLLTTSVAMMFFANGKAASSDTESIIIHYCDKDYYGGIKQPYIYYWNSRPTNISVKWPGKKMTDFDKDKDYQIEFTGKNKINFLFTDGSKNQTEDLTVNNAGEYWYYHGNLVNYDPHIVPPTSSDFRDESIYFVITTRFFDGDTSNNVHCDGDKDAGNPDSDPAWRGDFKGLIQKLDYIKALGFSAIWVTPVVENRSGYDYHGYHAFDFSKIDSRYESKDCNYQDLINACHAKGIKLIQDVVFNHTGNWGERNIYQIPGEKWSDRNKVALGVNDPDNLYHHNGFCGGGDWDNYNAQIMTIDNDCLDLNTENPVVYNYLDDCYTKYIKMGVDAFRVDTAKHISRLTFNSAIIPRMKQAAKEAGRDDFYMFGEVCTKGHDIWYRNAPPISTSFYTWADDSSWTSQWSDTDQASNQALCAEHYNKNMNTSNQPTSNNAFLEGNNYHTPDYSKSSGFDVIDFQMHWSFINAKSAFETAKGEDKYFNDSTKNVVYVDSHDYAPDECQKQRYTGGTDAWAENMDLMFTFRGIPCVYYGSEIEFQKGQPIDVGTTGALSSTGRAYFGDNIEGTVNTSDYGVYSNATGTMANTLSSPLAKQLSRLNRIRRAIPALRKGQYSTDGCNGNIAFKKRFTGKDSLTNKDVDSFVCVAISGQATFTGIPDGTYVDAITGKSVPVSGGTLTTDSIGQSNMRVYVLQNSSTKTGKIGEDTTYLK